MYNIVAGTELTLYLDDYGLSIAEGGIFNTLRNIGCLLGMLISAFLLPRFGKLTLVTLSYLAFAVFMFACGFSPSYLLFVSLNFLLGVATRFFDASSNAAIPVLSPNNTGFYLNLLHASFAVGGLVGPIMLTYMLNNGISWTGTYLWLGIAFMVLTLLYFLARTAGSKKQSKDNATDSVSVKETLPYSKLFTPQTILLIIILIAYCGHQYGISNWYHTFLTSQMATTDEFASFALSFYWIGVLIGRVLGAILSRKIKESLLLKIGAVAGAALMVAGTFVTDPVAVFVCVGASAIFTGAIIPLAMSIGFAVFPQASGKVSVLFSTAISIGAVIFPWLMGIVSDSYGLFAGMVLNMICLLILAVFALFIKKNPTLSS